MLLAIISLFFLICVLSACVEQPVDAKVEEPTFKVTEVLDNVYFVECENDEVNDVIQYLNDHYRFYKVIDIELKYDVKYHYVTGVYITTSQN